MFNNIQTVILMSGPLKCPNCETSLAKGSTFCIKCGTRISDKGIVSDPIVDSDHEHIEDTPSLEVEEVVDAISTSSEMRPEEKLPSEIDELEYDEGDLAELPEVDDTVLPEIPPEPEIGSTPATAEDDLSWDEDISSPETPAESGALVEIEPPAVADEPPDIVVRDADPLTWDETVREIDPVDDFEIDPADEVDGDAMQHLFPKGRGDTGTDFIDAVVGRQDKIAVKVPMKELESPTCPSCGLALTADKFEYPPYVYDAMGRARMEDGEAKLRDGEHEHAIESFEKAKILYGKAKHEKMIEEANKRIDHGYEEMADSHFEQGEQHLKQHEFEWAIVQFKKARKIYMFTTQTKKRAKCAERVRDCYIEWGKLIEDEGDQLVRTGETREALVKYQKAAEKYREGEDTKRLKGLEKKIRKA